MVALMTAGAAMAQDVIEITNIDDLKNISLNTDINGHYKLMNDIDLAGEEWNPIGNNPNSVSDQGSFNGTFDGNGHTISGLKIYYEEESEERIGTYLGLFSRIGSNGVVKNLTVSGELTVLDTDDELSVNVGAIAGVNHGSILDCTSNATVKVISKNSDGGGIAGENAGHINNCAFIGGSVKNTDYDQVVIGGIVGTNESNGVLQNCKVDNAEVSARGGSQSLEGMIYGQSLGTVSDCYYEQNGNFTMAGRTLYQDDSWNTICLPFNLTISGSPLDGATVMELDTESMDETNPEVYATRIEGETLYLNFREVDAIEAGKPYIIKWASGSGLQNPTFSGVAIVSESPVQVTSQDGHVTFAGNFHSKDIEDARGDNTLLYLGAANMLYYPKAPMSINSLRAYFQLNNGYVAGNPVLAEEPVEGEANRLTFHVSNQTTGINDTKWSMGNGQWSMNNGQWYDLSGRCVDASQLKSGLYIKDGKKILIRR